MDRKYKLSLAVAVLSCAMVGCSTNKTKKVEVKPNPLPKIAQGLGLSQVFSQSVSATNAQDPLRLRIDSDNQTLFILDPKGKVSAFRGKQKVWESSVGKHGLSSGVEAAEGVVVVGNKKGEVFALDQATGEVKWTAQLSGAVISPALILSGRAIVIANDGISYGLDIVSGKQVWTYKLPSEQLSLRGQAAPVPIDERTVLLASSNAFIYAVDSISGVLRMQLRVAISDGRSDIQRIIDIDGEPAVVGKYVVTTSYQGQVTMVDLALQRVIWSQDASSITRPEISARQVFVTQSDGKITSYDLVTGQKIWENDQLLNRKLSNPVILGQNLVVGDLDGVLHLIDPSSGTLVGRAKTSGEVRTLRVMDNQLYAATSKGALSVWQNR